MRFVFFVSSRDVSSPLPGTRVLTSKYSAPNSSAWDSHVWCSSGQHGVTPFAPVLSFLHMAASEDTVQTDGLQSAVPRTEFFFTSSSESSSSSSTSRTRGSGSGIGSVGDLPSSLFGDESFLNGQPLTVSADGSLPAFPFAGRRVTDPAAPLVVPPFSYGFVVFDAVMVAACMP